MLKKKENYGYTEICTYLHVIRSDRIYEVFQLICAIKSFKLNHIVLDHKQTIFKNVCYKYIILVLISIIEDENTYDWGLANY